MKKWTCREISHGMYPTVIKLEKYLFFILIAQACGSVSNDDAVVSNSTVTLSNFCVYSRSCFINVVTAWRYSCCESKASMLVMLCEYSVDLILTTTFCNLSFISNVIVAYISNVTVYISLQMYYKLFHNHVVNFIRTFNRWEVYSFKQVQFIKKGYRRWQKLCLTF